MFRTRVFKTAFIMVAAISVTAIGKRISVSPINAGDAFPRLKVDRLIIMPRAQGHDDWVGAIKSARRSIHMTMYHLTDKAVTDALISRAHDKSLDMRVIVDGKLS